MSAPAQIEVEAQFPDAFAPLWDESLRYYVMKGGRGGGRSWSIASKKVIDCTDRKEFGLCCREYQRSIKDSVKTTLESRISDLRLPGWTFTQDELRNVNGSRIVFAGLHNNVESIKSMFELDWAWLEEAENTSSRSLEILIPTLRKEGSKIYVTYNPENEDAPIHQRLVVNQPPRTVVITTTWRDNPFFPNELAEERDHMMATNPDLARHIYDGEFRKHSNAQIFAGKYVVQGFRPVTAEDLSEARDIAGLPLVAHPGEQLADDDQGRLDAALTKADIDPEDAEPWNGPYYGADFGFSADPSVLIECWTHENKLYISKEAVGYRVENNELPALYRSVRSDIDKWVIRADSARPETISYLCREHGLRVQGVKKWPGSVEDGITFLLSFDRIVVKPSCKHTIDELKGYSYKLDKLTGDPLPIIVDAFNHGIDCIRYALEPLVKPGRVGGPIV